jgi:PAS domain S-box-containing protein
MKISIDKIALGISEDEVPLGSHAIHFWKTEEEFERGVRFLEAGIPDETQYCVLFGHDEANTTREFLLHGRGRQPSVLRNMSANREGAQQRPEQLDLRDLIETLPALVLCALPDGSVEFANRAFHEYTGCSLQQLRGREWHTLVHADDQPDFMDQWNATLASGTAFETEARLRRSDGEYRWFSIKKALAVSRTEHGEPSLRALIACEDINERKREQFERRYSDERYRVVVETASDAIISIDDNGTIQFTNPATELIFGYSSHTSTNKEDAR